MRPHLAALAILFATTMTARADFVLLGAPHAARTGAKPLPPASKPASVFTRVPLPLPPDPPPSASWQTAHGFGDQVPLSFACRQIVPPGVNVIYGPGAQPSMLVSWKGGDVWERVLADAVNPLGLHLALSPMTVEIQK